MFINWQARELNIKIVYYGPALSGKTTNLEQIHAGVNPERRGELVSLKTHEDRTLFFDFMQLELGKIGGLTPKIHLYTVPGQAYYESSRKLVLRGVDGVVFVADSSESRMKSNIQSWRKMNDHLESLGYAVPSLPVVLQCNKQDLPQAIDPEAIGQLLQVQGPVYASVAVRNEGVAETFKAITSSVIHHVQLQLA